MIIIIPIIALIVGATLGIITRWLFVERKTSTSRRYAQEITDKAEGFGASMYYFGKDSIYMLAFDP
jgi:phosphate/sulfate permease